MYLDKANVHLIFLKPTNHIGTYAPKVGSDEARRLYNIKKQLLKGGESAIDACNDLDKIGFRRAKHEMYEIVKFTMTYKSFGRSFKKECYGVKTVSIND